MLSPLIFLLGALALFFSWKGYGLPNHYYPLLISLLICACLYHKRIWDLPQSKLKWVFPLLNVLLLMMHLKLFLGAGTLHPFAWMKWPNVAWVAGEKWSIGGPQLHWEPSQLALWEVDVTQVQTFLLVAAIVGVAVKFQPFTSWIVLLMVLLAIPTLVIYRWDFVFPSLLLTLVIFYLQADAKFKTRVS
jgi:hypothetical protein